MANETTVNGDGNLKLGIEQHKRAAALAAQIDSEVRGTVITLTKARLEYEGGPFVVMHNILGLLDQDTIDNLPDPKAETGNNPAYYKVRKIVGKKEKIVTEYFYDAIAASLPSVIAAQTRIDILNRSMSKDSEKFNDIPESVKNTTPAHRQTEIDRLKLQITTAENNVAKAFELYFQLQAFKEPDVKVDVEIIPALDPNTGEPLDGQDGRDFVVDSTKSPIVITSTIPGRSTIDTKRVSVGQFLKYDLKKAKEAVGGATYASILKTAEKGADNAPPAGGVAINTLETFVTRINDVTEYLCRIVDKKDGAEYEALKKLAEKDDDFFWNLYQLHHNLTKPLVGDPRSEVRFQAIENKREEKRPAA